jgi:hypothetical protein
VSLFVTEDGVNTETGEMTLQWEPGKPTDNLSLSIRHDSLRLSLKGVYYAETDKLTLGISEISYTDSLGHQERVSLSLSAVVEYAAAVSAPAYASGAKDILTMTEMEWFRLLAPLMGGLDLGGVPQIG